MFDHENRSRRTRGNSLLGGGQRTNTRPVQTRDSQTNQGPMLGQAPKSRPQIPAPAPSARTPNSILSRRDGTESGAPPQKQIQPKQTESATIPTVTSQPVQPSQHYPTAVHGQPDSWQPLIDPLVVFSSIWRRKGMIILFALLGLLLGVLIALSTPKYYSSTAELVIDPRDINILNRDLTPRVNSAAGSLAVVENKVNVLSSDVLLGRVVKSKQLDQDPEFNGEGLGGPSLLPSLGDLFSSSSSGGQANDKHLEAIEGLRENLTITRSDRTYVVGVTVKSQFANKAAELANAIAETFIAYEKEIEAGTAERATSELTSQLNALRTDVEKAEQAVERYKAENDLVNASGRLISDDEILRLNELVGAAKARVIELEARAGSVRNLTLEAVLEGGIPEAASSSLLTELRSQYETLRQTAQGQASSLGPRHPKSIEIQSQLTSAREAVQSELRRVVSSIEVNLKRAVNEEQRLTQELAKLKQEQGSRGGDLIQLNELMREAKAKSVVYESFLLRARETKQQMNVSTINLRIQSPATPALKATSSRRLIAIAGLVLGGGLGTLIAIISGLVQHANTVSEMRKINNTAPSPTSVELAQMFDESLQQQGTSEPPPPPPARRAPPAPEPYTQAPPVPHPTPHYPPAHAPAYGVASPPYGMPAPYPGGYGYMPAYAPPPQSIPVIVPQAVYSIQPPPVVQAAPTYVQPVPAAPSAPPATAADPEPAPVRAPAPSTGNSEHAQTALDDVELRNNVRKLRKRVSDLSARRKQIKAVR